MEIFAFAGAAGGGENLCSHLPGDLDGGQADAAGSGVDQHPFAPPHVAQPAQGKLGGEEADGDSGGFFEAQMFGLESDELRQREGVTGEAGGGEPDDLVARLESFDPRAAGWAAISARNSRAADSRSPPLRYSIARP